MKTNDHGGHAAGENTPTPLITAYHPLQLLVPLVRLPGYRLPLLELSLRVCKAGLRREVGIPYPQAWLLGDGRNPLFPTQGVDV